MLRRGFMLLFGFITIPLIAFAYNPDDAATTHEVLGNRVNGVNVWTHGEETSPAKAQLGDPAGRLTVKVRNGDVVYFRNEAAGGTHGVIFEKAKSELDAGVWEVAEGPQTLGPVNATFQGFDQADAQTTAAAMAGQPILKIKIKSLKAGAANGILFACNPHSKQGAGGRSMLGVIVLAEGDGKQDDAYAKRKGEGNRPAKRPD